jgi:periplasmic protein TonB
MYTSLISTPYTNNGPRAWALSSGIFVSLLLVLSLVRIYPHQGVESFKRNTIDTVELMVLPSVPLKMSAQPPTQTEALPARSAAAPAPRFAPRPTPARPSPSEVRSVSKPVITQQEESPVESPKIDPGSLYKKTEHRGSGNDPKAKADQGGAPNGSTSGTYDGPSRGTGGIGLDLAGFRFGKMDVPQDPYEDTGRLVFKIRVDAEGKIFSLSVIETTVSSSVADWYKQQLAKVRVVPTSKGERPEVSEGRIAITIVAR